MQKQGILCSCWEEAAWTRPSCCPSLTSALPSLEPVSQQHTHTHSLFFLTLHNSCWLNPLRLSVSVRVCPCPPAALIKVGCDNTVVRMVSSGRFVNRVSFSYRLLDSQELQIIKQNNVEDFCFNTWSQQDDHVTCNKRCRWNFFKLNSAVTHVSLNYSRNWSPKMMKCLENWRKKKICNSQTRLFINIFICIFFKQILQFHFFQLKCYLYFE